MTIPNGSSHWIGMTSARARASRSCLPLLRWLLQPLHVAAKQRLHHLLEVLLLIRFAALRQRNELCGLPRGQHGQRVQAPFLGSTAR